MNLYVLFLWLCLQGNEYFKQKKFAEAVECYSRSIALSPTAVAFANRAMAYLKLRRQVPTLEPCLCLLGCGTYWFDCASSCN